VKYGLTTATKKIVTLDKRIRLLAGGMRASKTISVLLYLISRCQQDFSCQYCPKRPYGCKYFGTPQVDKHNKYWTMTPTLTSIVSESMPHLRKGAIRDLESIMTNHGYWKDERWNKTDSIYTFETGSKIEFFSADQPHKIRGPSRDRLFVNEANNVVQEAWEQLLFRTREFAFADWNPVGDFYLYEDYGLQDDPAATTRDDRVDFLILTYKDNEALEPAIVEDIERKAEMNKQWSRVYAEGKRGEMEGKIFSGWKIIDEIPHEARLERRGLDFGYSNDPTVIVDIYYYNGGYIIDEVVYRTGMKNKDIADRLLAQPHPETLVIADSAELKSIDTIAEFGLNIIGVAKKPGYVRRGTQNSLIDWVQTQKISLTKRSTNVIKSYRNFMWSTDKEGNLLNEYDHFWSDGMMATIYGLSNFYPTNEKDEQYYDRDDVETMSLIY
jgi:phage terminase large subunit